MTSAVDDDDPVKAEYDVFITPKLAQDIYLLQYPNRLRKYPYNESNNKKPTELRIKPKSGFIEVDLPLNVHDQFDQAKGAQWGDNLQKSKGSGLETFGLPSGFAQYSTAANTSHRSRRAEQVDEESDEETERRLRAARFDFRESTDQGLILNKQTLGGQIIHDEVGKPLYMLGAFRQNQLHLSKVTGVVQMRPQFHHIDAQHQLESAKRRKEREATEPQRTVEPRAVQMTIKTAVDGENIDATKIKEFLRNAQDERWNRLPFHDEDADRAYEVYHEKLFESETSDARNLNSSITSTEYIDAISHVRHESTKPKKRPAAKKQVRIDESMVEGHEGGEHGGPVQVID